MRLRIRLTAAILVLSAASSPGKGILPSSFSRWSGSVQPELQQPIINNSHKATSALAGVEAVVCGEYGFQSGETGNYSLGSDTLQVTLYEMKDPSGAYGLYSFLRTSDMNRASITEHSSLTNERALALVGNLIVDVHGRNLTRRQADIKSLVASVAIHARQGPLPDLPRHMPTAHIVEYSDRYVLGPQTLNQLFPIPLGDSLGFANGAEAEIARYRISVHDVTLLLAEFPTPQLAAKTLAELQSKFNVNGSNPEAGSQILYAKQSFVLLAFVAGAPRQQEADTLLWQVRYDTTATRAEPPFEISQPGIITMVIGTLIGTGILCLFTLVASLAFGGFRLLIKRVLPGRIFDRDSGLQVIQLGLITKPIKSDDFYDRSGPPVNDTPVDKNLPDRIALRLFR